MPSLPAAVKGCNFLMTLEISSKESAMREGFSVRYEALGMSVRSTSGIRGQTGSSELLLFHMES